MEVVEVGMAAAQQELAQDRHVAVEHFQIARLDEIDPRVLEQPRIVERQHDRVFDLDCRRRLHAAREVLLGGRRVDVPRLAVEVLLNVRAFGDEVIFDADEPPLQAGVAVVRRIGQLRVDARMDCRQQRQQERGNERKAELHHRSTSLSSNSCARSYVGAISSAASVCFFASARLPLLK